MSRISYPIESLGLTNTVSALKSNNTPIEKKQFYIDGECSGGYKNIKEVLERLVHKGWLKAGTDDDDKRRIAVLNVVSRYSMATVALEHAKRGHPYLHHDDISMEFKLDRHHGLEMHYSVPYTDGAQLLFTLDCQLFLGKDFTLNEETSRIFFKFEKQCSGELRRDVNRNGIIKMILEWFKELFTPNSYAIANTMPGSKNPTEIGTPKLAYANLGVIESKSHEQVEEIFSECDFVFEEDSYSEDDILEIEDKDSSSEKSYVAGESVGYVNGFIDGVKERKNHI